MVLAIAPDYHEFQEKVRDLVDNRKECAGHAHGHRHPGWNWLRAREFGQGVACNCNWDRSCSLGGLDDSPSSGGLSSYAGHDALMTLDLTPFLRLKGGHLCIVCTDAIDLRPTRDPCMCIDGIAKDCTINPGQTRATRGFTMNSLGRKGRSPIRAKLRETRDIWHFVL